MPRDGVIVHRLYRHLGGWLLKVRYRPRRDEHRPIQLWMLLNLYLGKCWCGAPVLHYNEKWRTNPGQSCDKPLGQYDQHMGAWDTYIRTWWGSYRDTFLRQYPVCEICGAEKSSDVDHIEALSLGGSMWEPGNHQALCRACHKAKTAEDMGKLAASRRLKRQRELDAKLGHHSTTLEVFL